MQKISFGNRDYVKASEIARHFKYTQDYVGQLCRGDKVDARLVGRVWYVNLESVKEYRKTKHSTQKKTVKVVSKPRTPRKRSAVNPVVRAKTARKIQEVFPDQAQSAVKQVVTKYSRDKVSVIPVLGSSAQVSERDTAIKSKPKITIKVRPDSRKSTRYHVEKTPEITLKAKLKVSDKIDVIQPDSDNIDDAKTLKLDGVKKEPTSMSKASKPEEVLSFHPSSVAKSADPTEINAPVSKNNLRYSRFVLFSTITLAATALLLAVLSLGVGHYIESGTSDSKDGLLFDYNLIVEKLLKITR